MKYKHFIYNIVVYIQKQKAILKRVGLINYVLSKIPYFTFNFNFKISSVKKFFLLRKIVLLFLATVFVVSVNDKQVSTFAQQNDDVEKIQKDSQATEQTVTLTPMFSQDKETKEKEKETSKRQQQSFTKIHTLSEKEILDIKEKAKKYKELLEEDSVKRGIIRKIYVNEHQVFQINTAVNYATFICFFSQFTLNDVVLGASIFDVDIYEKRNCLILFPRNPFKNTNLTVFLNGKPYHFVLKEVSNSKEADFRVDVEKSPDELPDIQTLLRMMYKETVFEPYMSYCRLVKSNCKEEICKSIDVVLEVLAPVYMKGFKISKQKDKRVEFLNPYYIAETDDYYFVFSTEKSIKAKIDNTVYEIH